MKGSTWLMAALVILSARASADVDSGAVSTLAKMPVKEVTVFKDGHALVLHEGKLPTDSDGSVHMDYLPTPVIGTFWPYSADKNAKLDSVVSGQRRVLIERTALSVRELIEANSGAKIMLPTYAPFGGPIGPPHEATILGTPARSSEELAATNPANAPEQLPQKGEIVLVRSGEDVQALPYSYFGSVEFVGAPKAKLASEEFRNLLTLKLDWAGGKPQKTADVGLMYLQKGIRWIPGYRITIDGKGGAAVKLQATLINELTDLEDVTANLVIGVPTFDFKDTPDPISLQDALAKLGPYFQPDSRTGYGFSNAIMGQVGGGRFGENVGGGFGGMGGGGMPGAPGPAEPAPARPGLGPTIAGSEKSEDLFVFTLKHLTLKRGQRAVVPVAEYSLKYTDVFTVDIPFAPPPQVRANLNSEQQAELARLLSAPRAIHRIRMANTAKQPITTAPALILKADQVLGQSMIPYTAIGADVDLPITTATDVRIKKADREVARTPNALEWNGTRLARIDMTGTLSITNFRDQPVTLELTRYALGASDGADHDGQTETINTLEDADLGTRADWPAWYGSFAWPSYWGHVNGLVRYTWKLTLPAGKSIELGYKWHYFWQ